MVVYSFYIFDRHSECIYSRSWSHRDRPLSGSAVRPVSAASSTGGAMGDGAAGTLAPSGGGGGGAGAAGGKGRNSKDDAKLIFGVIYSLRNMVRNLGGPEDSFISYRTAQYKLHYYETASSLKFVMLTDTMSMSMRSALHQIYVTLYVEFVVKNPLSPTEHPGGIGVGNELFELALDQFLTSFT